MEERQDSRQDRFGEVATRVSLVSMVGNVALTVIKLLAGLLAHSGAMVSDAVHSASDVLASMIVIVGVRMSGKAPDKGHPYGHERFECVAAVLLAVVLALVGGTIGYHAARDIFSGAYRLQEAPGVLALGAAILSILSKEAMFWYTIRNARRIGSTALRAEAWHHRSDALSSVGALIGIGGARLGVPVLEPLASVLICLLILKVALEVFKDAIDRMVDHACDEATESDLRRCAEEQPGVLGVDLLQTRMFGSRIYVDLEIKADGNLTLTEGHEIAERVHRAVEDRFPEVKHIMVHVNPAQEALSSAGGSSPARR